MTDITKDLKLSRRNLKGHLTRTLTTLESLIKDDTGDVSMLQKYISKAEEQYENVEKKHAELTQVIEDDAEFETEEKWMSDCDSHFVQALVKARRAVERCTQSTAADSHGLSTPSTPMTPQQQSPTVPPGPPQSPPSSLSPASPLLAPRPSASCTPKMARMKYPTFNGNIRDYERFKALFNHCAAELTEIECFYQLTEAMVNSRERDMIKGCINVKRAWEILDEYFGDRDRVVDSLMKDLEGLKTYEYKGKMNIPAMGRFVQTLNNFETQAESVGLSGEMNDA